MAIKYKNTKYAKVFDPKIEPSLTEQEHKNSCDINIMLKNAARGMQIRGGSQPRYGFDDTTLDGVSHRIQKEQVEASLRDAAQNNEFDENELKHIPPDLQKKFGFKTKKGSTKPAAQNDDDKTTTKKPADTEPPKKSDSEPPKGSNP
ncbi:hypothetical protein [Apis mellifera associated microvirus 61]|nr:hypothetical protein [Apis mellifera associated microvirus 61]